MKSRKLTEVCNWNCSSYEWWTLTYVWAYTVYVWLWIMWIFVFPWEYCWCVTDKSSLLYTLKLRTFATVCMLLLLTIMWFKGSSPGAKVSIVGWWLSDELKGMWKFLAPFKGSVAVRALRYSTQKCAQNSNYESSLQKVYVLATQTWCLLCT
jgi:hypothetical protein